MLYRKLHALATLQNYKRGSATNFSVYAPTLTALPKENKDSYDKLSATIESYLGTTKSNFSHLNQARVFYVSTNEVNK